MVAREGEGEDLSNKRFCAVYTQSTTTGKTIPLFAVPAIADERL